ncbi:MAG: recombinase family protein [Phycisphaerales bacterium]|nr:recombinase family protein [Phycisphaerales bacterium]
MTAKATSFTAKATVRCAIYTRKSSEEGLEQEFNSLDAQRESAEAFIASQKHAGWTCLREKYDDGGFSGGNVDRPGLQKLMADIEAGKVDCVVVYKVDRLSRSLMDFARLMEVFDRKGVSFVSVTQQFNTTHSMGRLTLNILLSFAQFEREIISERTRDKIAAARKKGRWGGGRPLLGYDMDTSPAGTRLVVNASEAKVVNRIFKTYLETESLSETLDRLDAEGVKKKAWTAKDGTRHGGQPFDKSALHGFLTNVTFTGKVSYKGDIYDGLHEAIVDEETFRRAGELLKANRCHEGRSPRNKHGALLKGLVRCTSCGCAMGHHFAISRGRRYRYYVCIHAQKRGWRACPGPSLPAEELESFVVDRMREVCGDESLLQQSVLRAQEQLREDLDAANDERDGVARDLTQARQALSKATTQGDNAGAGEHRETVRELERRQRQLEATIGAMEDQVIDPDELAGAMEAFDPLWASLTVEERERLVRLMVREVAYDAQNESLSVAFLDGVAGYSRSRTCTTAS